MNQTSENIQKSGGPLIFVLELLLLVGLVALLTVFVTKSILLHTAQAQGPDQSVTDPLAPVLSLIHI